MARNVELRMVPKVARRIIGTGVRATALRLKSNIGTIWSAPYIGKVHRNTEKKRSIGANMQLMTCGCDAAHGPYGGCAERHASRAVTFPGRRSLRHDATRELVKAERDEGREHTRRERTRSRSTGLKVCVLTMSRLREIASFGICPAVLILRDPNQIPEGRSREAAYRRTSSHMISRACRDASRMRT